MSETMEAQIVRIEHEQGEGGWFYATSPDLKGLLVTESTIQALEEALPKAIKELYEACGVNVSVIRIKQDSDHKHSWVAVPGYLNFQKSNTIQTAI